MRYFCLLVVVQLLLLNGSEFGVCAAITNLQHDEIKTKKQFIKKIKDAQSRFLQTISHCRTYRMALANKSGPSLKHLTQMTVLDASVMNEKATTTSFDPTGKELTKLIYIRNQFYDARIKEGVNGTFVLLHVAPRHDPNLNINRLSPFELPLPFGPDINSIVDLLNSNEFSWDIGDITGGASTTTVKVTASDNVISPVKIKFILIEFENVDFLPVSLAASWIDGADVQAIDRFVFSYQEVPELKAKLRTKMELIREQNGTQTIVNGVEYEFKPLHSDFKVENCFLQTYGLIEPKFAQSNRIQWVWWSVGLIGCLSVAVYLYTRNGHSSNVKKR